MVVFRQAQIDSYLKNPDKNIKAILVYGVNEGLVAENIKSLVKTVSKDVNDPFLVSYLEASKIGSDFGSLAGEYNSQSLMGGRRVIVVLDADNNMTKNVKELFKDNVSDNLLIVSAGSLARNASLVSLFSGSEDMAEIACYEDRQQDIYSTARDFFVKKSITISSDALQILCLRLSNDRKSSLMEMEKLITYIGSRKNVEVLDVVEVISDVSVTSMDDLCYYTVSGDYGNSQKSFTKLLNENIEPISMIRTLFYHFEKLLKARSIFDETKSIDKAFSSVVPRIIFFREAAFKSQISMWDRDKILNVFELLYKSEKDCKTTNMPTEEIVSYMLLQISSAARRK